MLLQTLHIHKSCAENENETGLRGGKKSNCNSNFDKINIEDDYDDSNEEENDDLRACQEEQNQLAKKTTKDLTQIQKTNIASEPLKIFDLEDSTE